MQRGLEWVAQQLRDVPYAFENWQNIIKDIEASIRRSAASHFFFVKEAWRNHVAHTRVTYNEKQAADVLAHVRAFMEIIARRA